MRRIKLFENFTKEEYVITVDIDNDNFNDTYWSVYYPAAKIDAKQDKEYDIMDKEDFSHFVLDIMSGEIRTYLNNNFNADINGSYDKSLRNLNNNLETLSMNFITNKQPSSEMLSKLDEFVASIIRNDFDNAFYTSDKIIWSIYINGGHYKTSIDDDKPQPEKPLPNETSSNGFSQTELQNKIDIALDNRDFDLVKKLSIHLESKILNYDFYIKQRKLHND